MVGHQTECRSRDAMLLGQAGIERDIINAVLDTVENDTSAFAPEIDVLGYSFFVVPVLHSHKSSGANKGRILENRLYRRGVFSRNRCFVI